MFVGNPQRYRHLVVVLLAEVAAILPRNADPHAPPPGKKQERRDLGGYPRGRRHRRNRLNALALTGEYQPRAIVPKRLRSILVPNHAHKALDIRGKPRFTALQPLASHLQLSPLIRISPNS